MTPASAGSQTRHVRIAEDLAEMLGELLEVTEESSAKFLDPMIRSAITEAHKRNLSAIRTLKKARAKVRAGVAQEKAEGHR